MTSNSSERYYANTADRVPVRRMFHDAQIGFNQLSELRAASPTVTAFWVVARAFLVGLFILMVFLGSSFFSLEVIALVVIAVVLSNLAIGYWFYYRKVVRQNSSASAQ